MASDFIDMVVPLPEPSGPVRMMRGLHTPCTPEEMVATLMTALREAGTNTITVTCSNFDIDRPTVEFCWERER